MTKKTIINYLLLLGIGITWGSQFIFNNIAITTLPPYAVAASRTIIAGLCLVILTLFIKDNRKTKYTKKISNTINPPSKLPSKLSIRIKYLLIALFEAILPFYLMAWGQQYVDSSITAILIGTMPIFTGLLVTLFIAHEKLSKGMALSIFFGFIGLLVLLWPSLSHADTTHLLAEGAILAGALSFAIALVLIQTLPKVSPVHMTKNIFLIASVPLMLNILIFHPHCFENINFSSFLSILALGIFCSALAYTMFVTLISLAGAAFTSLSNYLVPIFGTLLGVVLLGDHINLNMILALIIILGSLIIAKLPMLNK